MFEEAVYNRLKNDSAFLSLLPGGVHPALTEAGLSRAAVPAAYAANGLLQPTCVVTGRGVKPVPGSPRDPKAQFRAVRQVVELWFYADRAAGYTDLQAALDYAYSVLQDRPLAHTYSLEWLTDLKTRAEELHGACLLRSDYEIIGSKGGT